ncbi:IS4 family transposase [Chryseobacterium sp. C-39]|uniref:IS4 family transposase n=1 Tax=Chryseobacterium muglaense TaxID=2893752 RepID=A0A9Q3UWB8_9FLAO|nr:IS4 family transposase [Chryseobacterium muglaense]MCC9034349.1 IS4 family transposase [Chryseobacterium muglaense]MCC9035461.1 IS4 family transposase [Chryseobacterium muglaense]MCC9036943.1 IS4 family transposase [Chryseobacterium muglaense]
MFTTHFTNKKKTSQGDKSSQLSAVLKDNLEKNNAKINKARLQLISMCILALCKVQTVSFHKLALAFESNGKADSSLRRLQRFIADFDLCSDLIAKIIFGLLPEKTNLKLVIDRTNWKFGKQNINIFMLGITYRNVAFPLLFMMLDKQGNSNSQERIALIKRFLGFFGKKCIDCILADREFVGEEWIKFLNEQKLRYYIRIRNNFKVFLPHKNSTVPVSWLFNGLKVGQVIHYPKIVKINGEYCYLSATLTQKRGEKPELLIIISYNKNEQSLLNYKERWQIETCFKAMKSSGFDIENTHLQDLERIEKLLCLVMIAFLWCYKIGDYLDRSVKAIPIKKHGHRAKSVFKYGLEFVSEILQNPYRKNFQQILQIFVM